jgi:hypothetical protein
MPAGRIKSHLAEHVGSTMRIMCADDAAKTRLLLLSPVLSSGFGRRRQRPIGRDA